MSKLLELVNLWDGKGNQLTLMWCSKCGAIYQGRDDCFYCPIAKVVNAFADLVNVTTKEKSSK